MRDRYEEIAAMGAELVAVGTGNARYARAFREEERIPFPVLLDDDARAARAASVKKMSALAVLNPTDMRAARRAFAEGYRQHRTGKRGLQLGATFVIGPGDEVRYRHVDESFSDHAPIEDVLAAVRGA